MANQPCHDTGHGRNSGRIGREVELKAWLWLTRQGYEVFDNIFPNGPIDVVAVRISDGCVLKLEVRMGTPAANGGLNYGYITEQQRGLDVWVLVHDRTTGEFALIPPEAARTKAARPFTAEAERARQQAVHERRLATSKACKERRAAQKCSPGA